MKYNQDMLDLYRNPEFMAMTDEDKKQIFDLYIQDEMTLDEKRYLSPDYAAKHVLPKETDFNLFFDTYGDPNFQNLSPEAKAQILGSHYDSQIQVPQNLPDYVKEAKRNIFIQSNLQEEDKGGYLDWFVDTLKNLPKGIRAVGAQAWRQIEAGLTTDYDTPPSSVFDALPTPEEATPNLTSTPTELAPEDSRRAIFDAVPTDTTMPEAKRQTIIEADPNSLTNRWVREEELTDQVMQAKYGHLDSEWLSPTGVSSSAPASVGTALAGALAIPFKAAGAAVAAASGVLMGAAAKDQFFVNKINQLNEVSLEEKGRTLNQEEIDEITHGYNTLANQYGKAEAFPEMASNLFFAGAMGKLFGKEAAQGFLKKAGLWGASVGQENVSETITGKLQSYPEYEAGLRDKPATWSEAFDEQKGTTSLMSLLMLSPSIAKESAVGTKNLYEYFRKDTPNLNQASQAPSPQSAPDFTETTQAEAKPSPTQEGIQSLLNTLEENTPASSTNVQAPPTISPVVQAPSPLPTPESLVPEQLAPEGSIAPTPAQAFQAAQAQALNLPQGVQPQLMQPTQASPPQISPSAPLPNMVQSEAVLMPSPQLAPDPTIIPPTTPLNPLNHPQGDPYGQNHPETTELRLESNDRGHAGRLSHSPSPEQHRYHDPDSRLPASKQPEIRADNRTGTKGKPAKIAIPNRRDKLPARYAVMEAESVQASHLPESGWQKNPSYGLTNERGYHTEPASQAKVHSNALQLDPELLLEAPDANQGAPVIDFEGNVLGGNGRAMSIKQAYANLPNQSQAYKKYLIDHAKELGLEPTQIASLKNPILVRQVEERLSKTDRQKLVSQLNESFTHTRETRAAGKSRGDRFSKNTLQALSNALKEADSLRQYFDEATSIDIVDSLIKDGVIQDSERNSYLGSDGLLNPDGKKLIEEALRGRVFKNYDSLTKIPTDILGKLDAVLPQVLIAENVGKAWDITKDLSDAAELAANYKKGTSPEVFLKQHDMVTGKPRIDRYSNKAVRLFLFALETKKSEFIKGFERYAQNALISKEAGALPGVGKPQPQAFAESFGGKESQSSPKTQANSPQLAPENNPQDDNRLVKIIDVSPKIVPEFKKINELVDWLKQYFANRREITIESTGKRVRFTNTGLSASVKRSREKMHTSAYPALNDLVKNAEYDSFKPSDPKHNTLGGQDTYYSAMRIGEKLYAVKLKFDVPSENEISSRKKYPNATNEDLRYKDHSLQEIEIASVAENYGLLGHTAKEAIHEITLGVLRGAVKPSSLENNTLPSTAVAGKTEDKHKKTLLWERAPSSQLQSESSNAVSSQSSVSNNDTTAKENVKGNTTITKPLASLKENKTETTTLTQVKKTRPDTPKGDNRLVKVVEVDPSLIPVDWRNAKKLLVWLRETYQGTSIMIEEDGQHVVFGRRGIEDSLKRKGESQRKTYAGLQSLLENAVFDHSEEVDLRHSKKVLGQKIYYSAMAFPDGKLYSVKFKLDVPFKGEHLTYKDHKVTEIEIAPVLSPAIPSTDGVRQKTSDAIHGITLAILKGAVKPSKLKQGALASISKPLSSPKQAKELNRHSKDTQKDNNRLVKVVEVDPKIVPEFKKVQDLVSFLKEYFAERRSIIIKDTGKEANFTNRGLKESAKRRGEEQRKAYAGLDKLVEEAIYDSFEDADIRHQNVFGQEIYYSAMRLGDKLYSVKFKLDAPLDGSALKYKDHKVTEIEIAPVLSAAINAKNTQSQPGADAIHGITLAILKGAVKPSKLESNTLASKVPSITPGQFLPPPNTVDSAAKSNKLGKLDKVSSKDLETLVSKLATKYQGAAKVKIIDSPHDLPQGVKDDFNNQIEDLEGVYDPVAKVTYLITENLSSMARASEVWLHENMVHHGLRSLFSSTELTALLHRLFETSGGIQNQTLQNVAKDYKLDIKSLKDRNLIMEEYLARLAEKRSTPKEKTAWERLINQVLAAWRKIVSSLTGSNGEMQLKNVEDLLDALSDHLLNGKASPNLRASHKVKLEQAAYVRLQADLQAWGEQVDKFVKNEDMRTLLTVSNTPDTLQKLGVPALPMAITGDNLGKILSSKKDHGLPADLLKQLPTALADPIMVFESATESDAFVVLTELKHEGRSVMVAVHLDKELQRIRVNSIASAHKRGSESWYTDQITQGRLLYQNKKKSLAWARTNRLQLPKVRKLPPRLKDRILTEDDIVKPISHRPLASRRKYSGLTEADLKDLHLAEATHKIGTEQPTLKEKWQAIKTKFWRKFEQGIFDHFASIKDYSREGYKDASLTTSLGTQLESIMYNGAPVWKEGAMSYQGKGLAQVFEPVSAELDRFLFWLVGRRSSRLMTEGKENLFTKEEIASLLKLNQGREELYNKVANDYATFNAQVLDFAEVAGLLNAETRKVWEKADYIPFYRIGEQGLHGSASKGLTGQNSGIKQLKGGLANIGDPLENILRNFSHLVDAAQKNNAAKNIFGDLMAAKMAIKIDPKQVQAELEIKGRQLFENIQERFGSGNVFGEFTPAQKQAILNIYHPKDGFHSVMTNGQASWYSIADPLLHRAMTSLHGSELRNNPLWRLMRANKRILTQGITLSPNFIYRNFVRELTNTPVVAHGSKVNPLDIFKATQKVWTKSEVFKDMQAAGAAFTGSGYLLGSNIEESAKFLRKSINRYNDPNNLNTPQKIAKFLSSGWEKFERLQTTAENSSRLAVYEALRKQGLSHKEASFQAKDLMDFTRRGEWAIIQALVEVVPFFGARLQGMHKLGRSLKENPKAFLYKSSYIALASIALYGLNMLFNGDDYEKLEDWDKDTYWHFWVGGQHFTLPKPFEVGFVFGTIPERIAEQLKADVDGSKFFSRVWAGVTEQLSMNPTPQLFKPIIEQVANKNFFTDRPIVDMRLQRKIPVQQYNAYTSLTAIKAAEIMDAVLSPVMGKSGADSLRSPARMEHLMQGYFGSLGSMFLGFTDMILRSTTDAPAAPSHRLQDWPLLGAMYRGSKSDPGRSIYITELYETLKVADSVYSRYKQAQSDGESVAEVKADLTDKELQAFARRKGLHKAADALAKLNKQAQNIMQSKFLSSAEKRKSLDKIQARRNAIAKNMMKRKGI